MRRRSKRHKPNPSAAAAPGVPSRGVAVAAAAAAAPLATPPPVPAPPHPVEEEEGDNDDEEPIVQSPQGANQSKRDGTLNCVRESLSSGAHQVRGPCPRPPSKPVDCTFADGQK